MTKFTVAVGDKVAYSVQFLKAIGMQHSDLAHDRGVVRSVEPLSASSLVAEVDWGHERSRVLVSNLARVGPNSRLCAI